MSELSNRAPEENESDEFDESQLKRDVDLDANASSVTQSAKPISETPAQRIHESQAKLHEEQARQASQNTLWRRVLFWGVSLVVAGVVLLGAYIIVRYLIDTGGEADPLVLSTWFASSVVQVVGLLIIITRHLFPQIPAEETPERRERA